MSLAPIQIVDEDDNPVSVATQDEAQERGLFHRIVKVTVEDNGGNVLLQKRSQKVTIAAGRWDNSAAGHVDAGEDYEIAAKRELQEELGVDDVELEEIGYYKLQREMEGKKLNRFYKIYRVVLPKDYPFRVQEDEVGEIRWFTREEVRKLVREHPEQTTDGVRRLPQSWQ